MRNQVLFMSIRGTCPVKRIISGENWVKLRAIVYKQTQEVLENQKSLILLSIKDSFCKANSQLLIHLLCMFNLLYTSISLSKGQVFETL